MHELAHIITSLILRVDVKEVTLLPVGVNAKYESNIGPSKELFISMVGPLASFIFSAILKDKTFSLMNICIGIFNLIPIYPMDGGRILRSFLTLIFRRGKSELELQITKMQAIKISNRVTKFFMILILLISIALVAYAKSFYFMVLAAYIFYISREELKKERFFEVFNYLQKEE